MSEILTWQQELPASGIPLITRQLVSIERPAGMVGDWDAEEWAYSLRRSGRLEVFPWSRVMSNGMPLRAEINRPFWDVARRYQAILRNELHPNEKGLALSTVFAKTHTALAVCDMAIRFGCTSLADISAEQYRELHMKFGEGRSALSEKMVTKGRLEQIFNVLDDLHDLFVYPQVDGLYLLNDGIRFSWLSVDDRRAAAASGRDAGQTEDAPEPIVFAHVTAAIEYVALFSDDILELGKRWRTLKAEPVVATRARPGEATARVAKRLLTGVDADGIDPLFIGNVVDKKVLSVESGTDVPTLYKKRFEDLIASVERWLSTRANEDRDRARSTLEASIAKFNAASKKALYYEIPVSKVGLPFTGKQGHFSPWPLTTLGTGRFGGASLEEAEADLWTACYLIVVSYIALRLGEGLTIKVDCLSRRVDEHYIRYRTSKGANSEGGTLVERPCPEIVVRAVEVAASLGEDARREFGSDDLFFVQHRQGASVLEESAVRQRLELFGRRTGASTKDDGSERSVIPNELRRFFVTMWNGYYEYAAKYESLRRFLNHAWITTTVRCGVRRNERPRLSEAQTELSVKVLSRKLLDGAGVLSDLPKSILPFLQSLKVRALPAAELIKELSAYAADQGFLIFAMPWGYCLWHHNAAKYAQCLEASLRRVGTPRIDAKRSCGGCSGCYNLVRDHIFDPFYETAIDRHEKISKNTKASTFLRNAASRFVAVATSVLGRAPPV